MTTDSVMNHIHYIHFRRTDD